MHAKRREFAFFAFATLGFLAPALDWPASSVTMVGEFGSPNLRVPIPGLVLRGIDPSIRASSPGEISFIRGASDSRTRLPSAFGTVLVAEGGDGIADLYAYLPAIKDPGALRLSPGALVATRGPAGLLDRDGFLFALYDRKSSRWINPRLFLPHLADGKAPVIRHISLDGKDHSWVMGEQKSIPQGSYSLAIEVAELVESGSELIPGPPHFLRVLINGEQLVELHAEVAAVVDGRLSFFSTLVGNAAVYDGGGRLTLASRLFPRGKTVIELLARDFVGNERSLGWTFMVE
ncbi:MAG: hypothetical protein WCQ50_18455 [Spirochaetota bacterium]